MTSEIRANTIKNRVGLGTVEYADTGTIVSGIITATGADINGDIDVDGHTNLDNVSIAGIVTASGGIFLPDSQILNIGNTSSTGDLQFFSDGTNSHIKTNTLLKFRGEDIRLMNAAATETFIICDGDNGGAGVGNVNLYYDNDRKFRTISNGVQVETATGDASLTIKAEEDNSSSDAVLKTSVTNNNASGYIFFGDNDDSDVGRIRYNHSNNSMSFRVNASSNALNIHSGGNIQVNGGAVHIDANGELAVFETDTNLAFTNSAKLAFDYSGNIARIRSSHNGSGTTRDIAIYTGNSDRLHITSTGFVGISSSSPQAKLDIYRDDSSDAGTIQITQDGTGDAVIDFQLVGAREYSLGIDNSDNDKFKLSGSAGLQNNTLLTVTNDGKVGINSTSPSSPLEIYTAASAAWKFRIDTTVSDGAGFYQRSNGDFEMVLRDASNNNNYIAGTSGALQFATSGTEKLRITSGGHVNIGGSYTQTSKTLYVNGTIEATSNLTCVNQIYLSGTAPQLVFTDTNQDSDYTIKNDGGQLVFIDRTNSNAIRMYANTGGFGGDRLYIADEIVHTGDTDTKIAFSSNTIVTTAGNATKMNINNTMVEINGVVQRQGGRQYSTTSTSTWQTIFSFSNASTNGFFFECAVSENNYSTIYKVGGSPNWNSCYFTSDHAGDSNHAHSSDITFRILNDSGTKRLQFKAVSYTTTRYLYAINVWVRSGYVNWS